MWVGFSRVGLFGLPRGCLHLLRGPRFDVGFPAGVTEATLGEGGMNMQGSKKQGRGPKNSGHHSASHSVESDRDRPRTGERGEGGTLLARERGVEEAAPCRWR